MKSLLLLRHGKARQDEAGLTDHQRSLAPRGHRAAALIGSHIAAHGLEPSLILCSSARRTQETLDSLSPELRNTPEVQIDSSLYLAPKSELLERIREVDDEQDGLLVIGHNPGLAELAFDLAGGGDEAAIERMARKFPTAAFAAYRFDVKSWQDVAPRAGHVTRFTIPKDLEPSNPELG